jgi:hypothetical protein
MKTLSTVDVTTCLNIQNHMKNNETVLLTTLADKLGLPVVKNTFKDLHAMTLSRVSLALQ